MEPASGNRVLIIEDEHGVVDLLALNLRKAGFTTSTAADGAVGLEKARNEKPALIILDLMLPKMPGLTMSPLHPKMIWSGKLEPLICHGNCLRLRKRFNRLHSICRRSS